MSEENWNPLSVQGASTGFFFAGEDFRRSGLDLNQILLRRPSSTFFLQAAEDADLCGGIRYGDILVVDRALEPDLVRGSLVVVLEGEKMLLRLLLRREGDLWLMSGQSGVVRISSESDLGVWGVVTYVLHPVDLR